MQVPEFAVGQVWKYRTRPVEPESSVSILRIDRPPGDSVIVHVAIVDVRIKNPGLPTGFSTCVPHAPIHVDALRSCVTELHRVAERVPDFEAGYAEWERAQGGVWTVSIAEVVEFVERALNS